MGLQGFRVEGLGGFGNRKQTVLPRVKRLGLKSGFRDGRAVDRGTQRAQYRLFKECTLNYRGLNTVI